MNDKKRMKSRHINVTPKIDNKSPHFDTSFYLNIHLLQEDIARVREIDKQNMRLLKSMNQIHRLGGAVNCWKSDIKYKSKFERQHRDNKKIMEENKFMLQKICQAESQYSARAFLEHWKSVHERFYSITGRLSTTSITQKQLADKIQTRCFFEIGLKGENRKLGRVVFELYDNIVPRTCKNFETFCRGTNGLSYKHTPFHRIVPGYWCQGGDVTKFNGTGGISIYGDTFDNENFDLLHAGPGILSMCADDNGRNNSKFNLTFKRLETVNGDSVVFGRVIDGMANVYKVILHQKATCI